MKEKNIKLLNVDEVKQFVSAAIQCDFDVDVYYNRVILMQSRFWGYSAWI